MLRRIAAVMFACSLAVGVFSIARAAGEHPIAKQVLDQVNKDQTRVTAARAALEAQETMGEAELCAYFRASLWLVYNALNAYTIDKMDVPDDLQELVSAGYLSSWPGNPLNEWKPMRVLALGDGFAPGEFVMQWAPPHKYSFVGSIKDAKLRPLSYALAVYGLVETTEPTGPHKALDQNSWVITPRGVVALLDTYFESANETLRKLQRQANDNTNESREGAE
jgi:hypothetical protein